MRKTKCKHCIYYCKKDKSCNVKLSFAIRIQIATNTQDLVKILNKTQNCPCYSYKFKIWKYNNISYLKLFEYMLITHKKAIEYYLPLHIEEEIK